MMTRKHFQMIADAIAATRVPVNDEESAVHESARRSVAFSICNTLQDENPRFDSRRFLEACRIN